MTDNREERIVVVSGKESVIVRSIEKRLESLGLTFTEVDEKPGSVSEVSEKARLFVVYLSDVTEEVVRTLSYITGLVRSNRQYAIVIGEKKHYEKLSEVLPEIKSVIWLDRPLEMETFNGALADVLETMRNGTRPSILIVDDDPVYAKIVREGLKEKYQVFMVTEALQTISMLAKHKIDLIILDYEMPVIDGPKLLEMLKADPTTADIPVVFLTGVQSKESVSRVLSARPKGYFLKSAPRESLINFVDNFFAG